MKHQSSDSFEHLKLFFPSELAVLIKNGISFTCFFPELPPFTFTIWSIRFHIIN